MAAPFYVDNDLIVSIFVTDSFGPLNPIGATFSALAPNQTVLISDASTLIVGNVVVVVVPKVAVTTSGAYTVVADVTFPDGTVRTHVVLVPVLPRPPGT